MSRKSSKQLEGSRERSHKLPWQVDADIMPACRETGKLSSSDSFVILVRRGYTIDLVLSDFRKALDSVSLAK